MLSKAADLLEGRELRMVSEEFLVEHASQTASLSGLSTPAHSYLHQTSTWSVSFLFVLLPLRCVLCIMCSSQVVQMHFVSPQGDLWDRRKSVSHGSILPMATCRGTVFFLGLEVFTPRMIHALSSLSGQCLLTL